MPMTEQDPQTATMQLLQNPSQERDPGHPLPPGTIRQFTQDFKATVLHSQGAGALPTTTHPTCKPSRPDLHAACPLTLPMQPLYGPTTRPRPCITVQLHNSRQLAASAAAAAITQPTGTMSDVAHGQLSHSPHPLIPTKCPASARNPSRSASLRPAS